VPRTRIANKSLIAHDFLAAGDSLAATERQSMPRTPRQVLPRCIVFGTRKSDAITRQDLPSRQIFPGITCRGMSAPRPQKSAIYRAF
jgi:hypothetical protein